MPPTGACQPRELGTADKSQGATRPRRRWALAPNTPLGLMLPLAAVSLAAEVLLAVILWKTRPEDAAGAVIAALVGVALLINFVAGVAVARRSEDRLSALAEQQAALRRVATLVARGGAPSAVFEAVAAEMRQCLHTFTAAWFRFENGDEVTLVAASGAPGLALAVGQRMPIEGDNLAATVLRIGAPARQDSLETAAGPIAEHVRGLGIRAAVGVPIIVAGRLWGLAVVGSDEPGPMPPDTEERVSDFADLAATAIANAAAREELIASRARIVAAADDARRGFERDLHDGAQQRLVSLGLKVRLAQESVPAELELLRDELSDVVAGLNGVATEVQEISRGIHPAILSRGGLAAAFKVLARRSAVPVSLDVAVERLPERVEVTAYYVVAEALANAAKHAEASELTVRAQTTGTELSLWIRDDGIGGADTRKGSGLVGLKDRVEVIGGEMRITSNPGDGTALNITIPLAS